MARANLAVAKEVQDCFLSAQEESSNIRVIIIEISKEELVLKSSEPANGSANEDFDTLTSKLSETQAALVVFCLSDNATGESGKSWMMLAWVPDGCKVRDKMLYSSSREDLKRILGLGRFSAEYSANCIEDVKWDLFQAYLKKDENNHDLLTESERLLKEENTMIHKETIDIKSTAMGVLPFSMSAEVPGSFQQFLSGESNWVDISLQSEVIHVESTAVVESRGPFQVLINENDARFIVARLVNFEGTASNYFIFSCPENVSIRVKMIMSSSKATVIAAASEYGIKIDKTLEIRGADEIDHLLRSELDAPDAVGGSSSSAAANVAHAKPTRPGRGRAKVGKFQAEEA